MRLRDARPPKKNGERASPPGSRPRQERHPIIAATPRPSPGRRNRRLPVLLLASALLIWLALRRIDPAAAVDLTARIDGWDLVLATAFLIVNQALSSLRYYVLLRGFGVKQNFARANRVNILSIAGSLLFFNIVGQSLTRSSLLRQDRKPATYGVIITVIERVVALFALLLLVAVCAISYFGTIRFDFAAKADAIAAAIAMTASGILTLAFALTPRQRLRLYRFLIPGDRTSFVWVFLLSLAMHASMLATYVILAAAVLPQASLPSLILPSSMVMLGASMPISFGGWGVRELTAAYAFAFVGLPAEAGVTMALGVGLLSILALLINVAAVLPTGRVPAVQAEPQEPPVSLGSVQVLAWLLPVACAAMIGFQIKLRTASGGLSVTGTDLLAVGAVLILSVKARRWSRLAGIWSVPGHTATLAAALAAVGVGFLIGWHRHGLTDWALYNRLLGAAVLAAYLYCGASAVALGGHAGRQALVRAYILGVATILVAEWAIRTIAPIVGQTLRSAEIHHYLGFVKNANAFNVQILVALALLLSGLPKWRETHPQLFAGLGGILLTGVFYVNSRGGFGVAAILLGFLLTTRSFRLLPLLGATACVLAVSLLPALWGAPGPAILPFGLGAAGASLAEVMAARAANLGEALRLWLDHPILGSGLGAFVADHIRTSGVPQVINSTYLWLLAELGIVGFAAFLAVPLMVLRAVLHDRNWRSDPVAVATIGCLIVLSATSLLHDIAYRRSLWLIMGALLARPNVLCRKP
jgi:uncharacterized membrane protein YbhN (UPF0104 family)